MDLPRTQDGEQPVFSADEYTARHHKVRQLAAQNGFDALLIVDPANLFYLTGYDAWSFYVPQALFFPVDGEPCLLLREMDAIGAHRTATAIARDNIVSYPETLIQRKHHHPAQWIGRTLLERGFGRKLRVGYEENTSFLSIRTFTTLAAALPEWDLVQSGDLVNWARLIKSDAEIGYLRRAGAICTNVVHTALAGLTPGRALNQVAADVLAAQARGAGGVDGDYPAIVPLVAAGECADTPHLTWSNRPVPADEPISLELAGVHHRYHAPLARTAVVGEPSRQLRSLAQVTVAALNRGLECIKPGEPAKAAADAFTAVLDQHGYQKNSRLGYPIGIGYPPDWGEGTVSIRFDDETVLEPNMAFHVIAGMWLPGCGFEVSESVYVTDDGAQPLCDVPRELITLDA